MKTPVSHEQMLRMFESNQKTNMEVIRVMQTAVNATTKSETDRIALKLDSVIKRQDIQNGTIGKNGKDILKITKTTESFNRFKKSWKWIIFVLFVFSYSVAWMYDNIDFKELVIMIFKKV